MPGMLRYETGEIVGGTGVGKRATRVGIGHHHLLAGAKDLGGLPHEMNAAKHNHPVLQFLCYLCQSKRIADEVCQILDFPRLVIVGEDHGVLLFLEFFYFLLEIDSGRNRFINESVFNIHFTIFLND